MSSVFPFWGTEYLLCARCPSRLRLQPWPRLALKAFHSEHLSQPPFVVSPNISDMALFFLLCLYLSSVKCSLPLFCVHSWRFYLTIVWDKHTVSPSETGLWDTLITLVSLWFDFFLGGGLIFFNTSRLSQGTFLLGHCQPQAHSCACTCMCAQVHLLSLLFWCFVVNVWLSLGFACEALLGFWELTLSPQLPAFAPLPSSLSCGLVLKI